MTPKPTAKKPWNKNKKGLRKRPFAPDAVQVIKHRLAMAKNSRDWCLFGLGIDSRLREIDLLNLKVSDVSDREGIKTRVTIIEQKTQKPFTFEISPDVQNKLRDYVLEAGLNNWGVLFPSPRDPMKSLTTRTLRNLVKVWCDYAGLQGDDYGTHSLRRTLPSYIYAQTGNLRACQLLLNHSNIGTTARYLGIEQNEALEIASKYRL